MLFDRTSQSSGYAPVCGTLTKRVCVQSAVSQDSRPAIFGLTSNHLVTLSAGGR